MPQRRNMKKKTSFPRGGRLSGIPTARLITVSLSPPEDDPNWPPYVEQDEEFLQRKHELENWMSEECSALFTLDGEPTYSNVPGYLADYYEAVPIPANYRLYDYYNYDVNLFKGFSSAVSFRDKYIKLLRMKSTVETLEDLDAWEAEVKELLDESAVTAADVEQIVKTVGSADYYAPEEELYTAFKAKAEECLASADPETGKIHINLYWELYMAFRALCIGSNTMYGDLDRDGRVSSADATLVLQAYAELIELNANQRCAINDEVNSVTTTKLLQATAQIIEDFTCEDSCYFCPARLIA